MTDMALGTMQRTAIERCANLQNRIVAVTGAAGTGKTTLLRTVTGLLIKAGYRVALAAPTGKAAKRIKDASGYDAMTLHRLLEYTSPGDPDPKTGLPTELSVPQRYKNNPIEYDVVLVDEYRMVSHALHRALIDALPAGGCLRVFGDVNQLPAVDDNQNQESVFETLLRTFRGITLDVIYRQAEGSNILLGCECILKGRFPKRAHDFNLVITDSPVDRIKGVISDLKSKDIDFAHLENQIITPTRKTWVGTHKLNVSLQSLLGRSDRTIHCVLPRNKWDETNAIHVYLGDKIIWTKNDYTLEIYNGETGIIEDIDADGTLVIDFGDRVVTVPPLVRKMVFDPVTKTQQVTFYDARVSVELAYALTTHKAQGSEYKNVIYVMNKSATFIQSRANLYTGVSRAKRCVHIVTDQTSLVRSLNTVPSR